MNIRAPAHPLEELLMQQLGVNAGDLHRLGVFLLAHAMIDELLTWHLKLRPDLATVPRHFSHRLDRAKRTMPAPDRKIAQELNTARIDFLHGRRVPKYRGSQLTTEEGLSKALNDAAQFIIAELKRTVTLVGNRKEGRR
jgi:hypothetical protein